MFNIQLRPTTKYNITLQDQGGSGSNVYIAGDIDGLSILDANASVQFFILTDTISATQADASSSVIFSIASEASNFSDSSSAASVIYGVSSSIDTGTDTTNSTTVYRISSATSDTLSYLAGDLVLIQPFIAAPFSPYFPQRYIAPGTFPTWYFPLGFAGGGGFTNVYIDGLIDALSQYDGAAGLIFRIVSEAVNNSDASSAASIIYGLSGSADNVGTTDTSVRVYRIVNSDVDSTSITDSYPSVKFTIVSSTEGISDTTSQARLLFNISGEVGDIGETSSQAQTIFGVSSFSESIGSITDSIRVYRIVNSNIDSISDNNAAAALKFTISSEAADISDASSSARTILGLSGTTDNSSNSDQNAFVYHIANADIIGIADLYGDLTSTSPGMVIIDGVIYGLSDLGNADLRIKYVVGGSANNSSEGEAQGGLRITSSSEVSEGSDSTTNLIRRAVINGEIADVADLSGNPYNLRSIDGSLLAYGYLDGEIRKYSYLTTDVDSNSIITGTSRTILNAIADTAGDATSNGYLNGIFSLNASIDSSHSADGAPSIIYTIDSDLVGVSIVMGTISSDILEIIYTENIDLYIYRTITPTVNMYRDSLYEWTSYNSVNYFDSYISRTVDISVSIDRD